MAALCLVESFIRGDCGPRWPVEEVHEMLAVAKSAMANGCGEEASNLRKCSGCRAVAYYSRACQLRHWKEGGHKQQCVQLAAGSAEAGSSTRGGH
ncbi:hypothetical protein CHLNCDRAFT_143314 [Chlorella variabilis]|uniref:MYND-type domain-containing protein n=1 Tax=Chlorella variabilis TaxID=554065 RepID=E1Z9Y3_CHLVA|nr:hypothetical protein CHLNCDRAFT_143314 [Chlorella variabilis]EFN57855.1 hypothetical protein CHLNCDRAFT_143314 [Chlorella variabilis]|eukprot:XP_005849957.1 hypothetical protein CHLNCDRAFT_143314 [Chlorella variabilis]